MMLRESDKRHDANALKEVIRLLNLALDDCQRLLNVAERGSRDTGQDNQPSDS